MALILKDRVKETTTVTGTGTASLLGAVTGFQSFSAIGNANTTYYCIAGQGTAEWEVGIGTYTSSGTTLARTTVLSSSNSDTLVNFSAGTKDVFVTYPSGKSVNQDASGNVGIGTTSPGSKLDVKGTLRLSGSSSGYVGLAPAAEAGSTTYTLPSADGSSGQVLSTNGTGTLSWASGATGFKNRIINGAMVIDQRNNGAEVNPVLVGQTTSILDRWQTVSTVASKFKFQQNAGAVTPPLGFRNYAGFTSLSAYTVGAAEVFSIQQKIEGFNTYDFSWGNANAQTATLSFWIYSSLTGTFGGAIRNGSANRSYPYTYSIPVANTWTQISVTIPGDTTGTWATDNTTGVTVTFSLGIGSTFSGTAGTWAAANYASATGAVSVVGTSGATFYITGVQLEKGSVATGFDYRSYGTELGFCQRYYYKQQATGVFSYFCVGQNFSTTVALAVNPFPVQMRTAPTALEQTGTAGNYQIRIAGADITCTSVPVFNSADTFNYVIQFFASGLTAGQSVLLKAASSSAYLAWSAEL